MKPTRISIAKPTISRTEGGKLFYQQDMRAFSKGSALAFVLLCLGFVACGGESVAPISSAETSPRLSETPVDREVDSETSSAPATPTISVPRPEQVVPEAATPSIALTATAPSDTGSAPTLPVRKITVSEKWSVETGFSTNLVPLVGRRHIAITPPSYIPSGLVVLDKETGAILWKKPQITDAFLFDDVVVAWRPFQVFEADTGKLLWRRPGSMRYLAAAAFEDRLAFISVEKNPWRYRLTVAELRTGKELLFADHPGLRFEGIESKMVLSFDASGLWVANIPIPLDPQGFAITWFATVAVATSLDPIPCRMMSDATQLLTWHHGSILRRWIRSDPTKPAWRFERDDVSLWCDSGGE